MQNTVLITGASSGIGKEMAKIFAANGHDLVLVARSENKLNELKEELVKEHQIEVLVIAADLLDEAAIDGLAKTIKEKEIEVEYLLNNAGVGYAGVFAESDWEKTEQLIRLNILSLVKMSRLFLPDMLKRNRGTIVNTASALAFGPTACEAVYAASKAFVLSFSQALYEECRGTSVKVLTLCPGATDTNFFKRAHFKLKFIGMADSVSLAKFAYKKIMRKRPVMVHRLFNKFIGVSSRLLPRGFVRRCYAYFCKIEKNEKGV